MTHDGGFFSGVPVAVDAAHIEKELAKFWKPADSQARASEVTRVCLSNLVVSLPDDTTRARAQEVLPALARRFPSRMLLLTRATDAGGGPRLSAWISAVCHRPGPGTPPVCCEQITLEARDDSQDVLRGAVTPLLVPDSPVVLVFFGPPDVEVVSTLRAVVDRVIVDTRRSSLTELRRTADLLERGAVPALDDLAWRGTEPWRGLLRDLFEEATVRPLFRRLRRVELHHGTHVSSAALLLAWLASRLGWRFHGRKTVGGELQCVLLKDAEVLEVLLRKSDDSDASAAEICRVELRAHSVSSPDFLTLRRVDSDRVALERQSPDACLVPRQLPLARESDVELLGEALQGVGDGDIYREALFLASRLS